MTWLVDESEGKVERTPGAKALTFEGQSITYRELSARTKRLARHLIGKGVGPDTAVAIGMRRSLEMMVGIYAVLRAGGAYVPLDPEQPADRVDPERRGAARDGRAHPRQLGQRRVPPRRARTPGRRRDGPRGAPAGPPRRGGIRRHFRRGFARGH